MIDPLMLRVGALVLIQQVIGLVKETATRWIIKNWFSTAEITAFTWFSRDFLTSLTLQKVAGLGLIAAFTLVTFPLGIWIGSFKLGLSSAVSAMVSAGAFMLTAPISFLVINRTVGEMALTTQTALGLLLIEGAQVLAISGWWLVYGANAGAV